MSKQKRVSKQKLEKLVKNEEVKKKDSSEHVFQQKKIDFELNIRLKHELKEKQKIILETMKDKSSHCVMIDGIYGTSKTYLAVLASLQLMNEKKIDQILYIRNPTESSSTGKLGFLKGEAGEKMAPYAAAFNQKLDEFLPTQEVDRLNKEKRVEVIPLGFTRGLNWNCKAIIVDEAACLTYDDIFLLMTRCGPFTKIFFIGDSQNQNDIGSKTGFSKMFNMFNDKESMENGVFCFELKEIEDVVRSGFVRFIMKKTGLIKPKVISTGSEPMFDK